MPTITVIAGILLILIGAVGYLFGLSVGSPSITAFIPAAFGLVLAVLGIVAGRSESLRKHLMHAAVILGLIGFIVPAVRIVSKLRELTFSAAFLSQVAMAVVCLVFVVLAVRSFIQARRDRGDAL